jgi:hypothetical protein
MKVFHYGGGRTGNGLDSARSAVRNVDAGSLRGCILQDTLLAKTIYSVPEMFVVNTMDPIHTRSLLQRMIIGACRSAATTKKVHSILLLLLA